MQIIAAKWDSAFIRNLFSNNSFFFYMDEVYYNYEDDNDFISNRQEYFLENQQQFIIKDESDSTLRKFIIRPILSNIIIFIVILTALFLGFWSIAISFYIFLCLIAVVMYLVTESEWRFRNFLKAVILSPFYVPIGAKRILN